MLSYNSRVYIHLMQEEVLRRLPTPKLGPCACAQVRRLATESLQELQTLLTAAESAATKAFTANQENRKPTHCRYG